MLLVASGSGFLALVAWASEDPAGLAQGRSDDAQLVMVTFGVLAVGCLLGAWWLMAWRAVQ